MQQIIFGVYGEGPTDSRYFPTLVERYLTAFCAREGIDIAILPSIHISRRSGGFVESLKIVEQNYPELTYVFVHSDADAPDISNVLEHKWQPWLDECSEPKRWVAVIPVRMTESWMLADRNALKSTFIISDTNLEEILGSQHPESIQNPKGVLAEIMRVGRQKRIYGFEENIAQRCDFSALERLPSFQFFQKQLSNSLSWFGN